MKHFNSKMRNLNSEEMDTMDYRHKHTMTMILLVMIIDTNDEDDDVGNRDDGDNDDGEDDGYPANSPHDKIPPWWEYVINRGGGFLSPAYSHH